MAIYHVSVTGRDRRHLTALGPKLRIIVVGYREDKRGAVVDAYIPAEKVRWLERKGYGVTFERDPFPPVCGSPPPPSRG